MNAIKRHLLFSVWVLCCVLLVTGGLGWLHRLRKSSQRELARVAQKIQQREHLLQQARLTEPVLAESVGVLPVVAIEPSKAKPVPRKPMEVFIALAGARDEWRRLAASQQVALLPEEFFGFVTYAHEGPRENQLAAVHEQLGLAQQILEKLFAAQPDKLLAVRREHPRVNERIGVPEAAADFFELDGRLDLRVVGLIEGQALQVEFIGQTLVLRNFLQALATAPEPLLVRSVEVEPIQENQPAMSRRVKFSVIIEAVMPMAFAGNISGRGLPQVTPPVANPIAEDRACELFAAQDDLRGAIREATPRVRTEGFVLLSVQREPYRLQLVGYYGAPGNYTATFVSSGWGGTVLAREGHQFASLGLTLKFFGVERCGTKNPTAGVSHEMIGRAQLWDERDQAMVTLVSNERLFTAKSLATIRFEGARTQSKEFREGESFLEGGATCRIEHIQLDPAEVVMVRLVPGVAPERLVLQPASHASPKLSANFPGK